MKHGKRKAVLVIIIGLLLGYVVATQLSGFLGIEFIAKDLPAEVTPDIAAPVSPVLKATPLDPVAAIVLPDGALLDDLYVRAAGSAGRRRGNAHRPAATNHGSR